MLEKFVEEFHQLHPDRKILFLCKAGSHFFNLNTANSDTDYKGIYLPSPKEMYDGESSRPFYERKTRKEKNTKNDKDDVDLYMFSITNFLDLLSRGDFNCMELLFCTEENILITSPEYEQLREIRESLIVNDISCFLGFIKKEYRRYGVNIHHYKEQQDFVSFLKSIPVYVDSVKNLRSKAVRLRDVWENIKEYSKDNNFILFTTSETGTKGNDVPTLKIAQRFYQDTVTLDYVISAIETRLERYGHRQKHMAATGHEFKGLYHALRLIYEANDIYDHGRLFIPFDADRHKTLLDIKNGNVDQEWLFNLIDKEIDSLQERESVVRSNKPSVKALCDKLAMFYTGKYALEYIRSKYV